MTKQAKKRLGWVVFYFWDRAVVVCECMIKSGSDCIVRERGEAHQPAEIGEGGGQGEEKEGREEGRRGEEGETEKKEEMYGRAPSRLDDAHGCLS